ncbi:MAG TPA: glycosyltransferase family 87 protein, partial [Terriglobales bacterium]
ASPAASEGLANSAPHRKIAAYAGYLGLVLLLSVIFHNRLIGMNDLYARWHGTREFVLHRLNPYGAEVSQQIRSAFYGEGAEKVTDEQRFAYPAYVILILWPLAYVSFPTARLIALPWLIAALAGSILGAMRLVNWPQSLKTRLTVLAAAMLSAPAVANIRLEQLSNLSAFFLMAGFFCLSKSRYALAGILMALGTIKPHMALLPAMWFLFWTANNWHKYRFALFDFALSMILLVTGATVLLPGWIVDFVGGVRAYWAYTGHDSLVTMVLGPFVGLPLTAVLLLFVFGLGWSARKADAQSAEFAQTSVLIFALPALVVPTLGALHHQIMLLPLALLFLQRTATATVPVRFGFRMMMALWTALGIAHLLGSLPSMTVQMLVGLGIPFVLLCGILFLISQELPRRWIVFAAKG